MMLIYLQGYCVPGCAENVIGFTFYKYVLTNVVSINGVETLSALAYKCLHMTSHVDPPWVRPCFSPFKSTQNSFCGTTHRPRHDGC